MKKVYRVYAVVNGEAVCEEFKKPVIEQMKSLDMLAFKGSTYHYHTGQTVYLYDRKRR